MAKKFSEAELIGAIGGFHMYVFGALIEQDAIDHDKVRDFLQRRLDEKDEAGEDDPTALLLRQSLIALDRIARGRWTLQ